MKRLVAWWRCRRRGPLVDEMCRECFEQLHERDCWETRVEFPNTTEMGAEGGTFMTAYWCREHRPAGAERTVW